MNRDQIKSLLLSNDRAVERGMLVLLSHQTEDEQHTSSTVHSNGKGFNYHDASYGTYLARWVQGGKSLTGKHLAAARKMCIKYAKQIEAVSQAKLEESTITYTVGSLATLDPFPSTLDALIRRADLEERKVG